MMSSYKHMERFISTSQKPTEYLCDDKSMRECAEKILTKNVKIPSPEVEHIRQDARMYIDKSDT